MAEDFPRDNLPLHRLLLRTAATADAANGVGTGGASGRGAAVSTVEPSSFPGSFFEAVTAFDGLEGDEDEDENGHSSSCSASDAGGGEDAEGSIDENGHQCSPLDMAKGIQGESAGTSASSPLLATLSSPAARLTPLVTTTSTTRKVSNT